MSSIGIATMMISPASAQTVTPPGVNGFQHFVDCFGAMLNDPNTHAQYCAPGQALPNTSISTGGGAAYTPPPPPDLECDGQCVS